MAAWGVMAPSPWMGVVTASLALHESTSPLAGGCDSDNEVLIREDREARESGKELLPPDFSPNRMTMPENTRPYDRILRSTGKQT